MAFLKNLGNSIMKIIRMMQMLKAQIKNRGITDVLFFCVDGLPGFKEAIQAVFPSAQIQRCVIHMLRNSFKYLNYNDLKKFCADFKNVYNAPNESAVLDEL